MDKRRTPIAANRRFALLFILGIGCSPDAQNKPSTVNGGGSGTAYQSAGSRNVVTSTTTGAGGVQGTDPVGSGVTGGGAERTMSASGIGGSEATRAPSAHAGRTDSGDTSATVGIGGAATSSGGATANGGAASGGTTASSRITTSGGGVAPNGGSSASGGQGGVSTSRTSSTGGTAANGGATTGGSVASGGSTVASGGSGSPNLDDQVRGVHGRILLTVDGSQTAGASVAAVFYDREMRMDAFAAYPPSLHEVKLQQNGCVLTTAATRACNPPCGASQYCGADDTCEPTAALASAGTLTVEATGATVVTLTPNDSLYAQKPFPFSSIGSNASVTVKATGSVVTAFEIRASGVDASKIGLPKDGGTLAMQLGSPVELTWNTTPNGIVQLLLNAGWHGAPPTATLICEAPASAGHLTVPKAIADAYPATDSIGMTHTSMVRLLQRSKVTVNAKTIELVVVGYRGVIFPTR